MPPRFAVLFPGQGSQFVGMGAELFELRRDLLVERADAVLGWSLRELCLEGPEEELTRTEHAQPAIFAVGYALWEELASRLPQPPSAAAGHSLGEYTALAAAGAIDFETGLRVVAARGEAMAAAADAEPSGMAALLGADLETAEGVCAARRAEGGRLWVANINAPGQVVVAGGDEDLAWLDEHGRDQGVRRVVRLKVAGAFHSPFMEPAGTRVREAVAGLEPAPPAFPVYANVTAQPLETGEMAETLAIQVVSPVRFAETLQHMAGAGIDTFVHVGPGDVTAGMAKRTVPGGQALVVSAPEDVGPAVEALSTMADGRGE